MANLFGTALPLIKFALMSRNTRPLIILVLTAVGMASGSCGDGCMICTSDQTPEKRVCKDDYQKTSDYNDAIYQHELLENGNCE